MKEHFQDYGVRKWAGDDLIELQSEPLAALQALVEPYAPCIIQGCEVTENGNGITVSPGLVALKGKDSKGNACVKIARFAGIESATSIYLTLACETVNRAYGDGKVKDIAYDYKAVASSQRPEEPFLEISGKEVPRLVDALGITQKLDREGGDASQTKVEFLTTDVEELKSGNPLSKLFGAIKKWLDGIKEKLDGIEAGAKVNVQADWGNDDNTSDAYIKNKPGNATTSTSGLMSKDDKTKLEDIEANANNYMHPTHTSIQGTIGNMTPGFGEMADTYTYNVDSQGHVTGQNTRTIRIPDTVATQSAAGLMSKADKEKLDGIAAGAQVNVQADWSVTDVSSDAFIKNKPASLPASGGTAQTISSVLPLAKGGTGKNNGEDAANVLLNSLSAGTDAPHDGDFYISQYANGTQATYHRRPVSKLLEYIKSKLAKVATSGSYNDLTNKPTASTIGALPLSGGTMTGPIKHSTSENGADPYYISAGGGVGKNVGKYGLKLLSHDGNGQSGIGVDLTGYSYEMTIAANCSSSGTTHITFAKHTNTSTTYTRLAEIDGSGNFNAIGQIKENGTRVYSPNNKPTPGIIGAAAASHTHDYLPLAGGRITGPLRLQKTGSAGEQYLSPRMNFGDGDEVYMEEATDGHFTIYGKNSINLSTTSGISTVKVNGTPIKDALPSATTSASGLMSAADKKNLDMVSKFKIVGYYVFNQYGKVHYSWGYEIGCKSGTDPVTCYEVELPTSSGFSTAKTYTFIPVCGYEHKAEFYGVFCNGGDTKKIIYRHTATNKAELSGYALGVFIVELN